MSSKTNIQTNGSNLWNLNLGYLPMGYKWLRDKQGNVRSRIKIKCTDSDGVIHYDEKLVGIKEVPERPVLKLVNVGYKSLTFSFYSNGSMGYKIFYDTNSGHPYTGTGALQGSSNIGFTPTNVTTYTLTGLTANIPYYISVKGLNVTGESVYSFEITGVPHNNIIVSHDDYGNCLDLINN